MAGWMILSRREIQKQETFRRAYELAERYRKGETLQQIGDSQNPPITRERVRQLVSLAGVTKKEGGSHIRFLVNMRYSLEEKKKNDFIPNLQCARDDVVRINGHGKIWVDGAPTKAYLEQKRNAKRRGIEWNFTFPTWWRVWQESGKWDQRGRGKGYCMARIGDTGGYEPDNVEIITTGQNFSDSYYKHPWKERFPVLSMKKTHCKNGHELTEENRYPCGNCKICSKIRSDKYREKLKKLHALS